MFPTPGVRSSPHPWPARSLLASSRSRRHSCWPLTHRNRRPGRCPCTRGRAEGVAGPRRRAGLALFVLPPSHNGPSRFEGQVGIGQPVPHVGGRLHLGVETPDGKSVPIIMSPTARSRTVVPEPPAEGCSSTLAPLGQQTFEAQVVPRLLQIPVDARGRGRPLEASHCSAAPGLPSTTAPSRVPSDGLPPPRRPALRPIASGSCSRSRHPSRPAQPATRQRRIAAQRRVPGAARAAGLKRWVQASGVRRETGAEWKQPGCDGRPPNQHRRCRLPAEAPCRDRTRAPRRAPKRQETLHAPGLPSPSVRMRCGLHTQSARRRPTDEHRARPRHCSLGRVRETPGSAATAYPCSRTRRPPGFCPRP